MPKQNRLILPEEYCPCGIFGRIIGTHNSPQWMKSCKTVVRALKEQQHKSTRRVAPEGEADASKLERRKSSTSFFTFNKKSKIHCVLNIVGNNSNFLVGAPSIAKGDDSFSSDSCDDSGDESPRHSVYITSPTADSSDFHVDDDDDDFFIITKLSQRISREYEEEEGGDDDDDDDEDVTIDSRRSCQQPSHLFEHPYGTKPLTAICEDEVEEDVELNLKSLFPALSR
jgi:hypothetical protein